MQQRFNVGLLLLFVEGGFVNFMDSVFVLDEVSGLLLNRLHSVVDQADLFHVIVEHELFEELHFDTEHKQSQQSLVDPFLWHEKCCHHRQHLQRVDRDVDFEQLRTGFDGLTQLQITRKVGVLCERPRVQVIKSVLYLGYQSIHYSRVELGQPSLPLEVAFNILKIYRVRLCRAFRIEADVRKSLLELFQLRFS